MSIVASKFGLKQFFGRDSFQLLLTWSPVWIMFAVGMWLVVFRGLGPNWEFVPGDLGDGRFNNFILEHFFLWLTGKVADYWNAPFFYPFSGATAFSDVLWGSTPFYVFFRLFGLSRETAFQYWYACSFITNYLAVVYVLSRAGLKPLAVGMAAFFFTFGIPLIAQGGHVQMYYRFGVPFACFYLIEFFKSPKFTRLLAVMFWFVWQFYLSIYLGVFLFLLLIALAIMLPSFETGLTLWERLYQWPAKLKQVWFQMTIRERTISIGLVLILIFCLLVLLWPYYQVSRYYGFRRNWSEILTMLPVLQSFFINDIVSLWQPISLHLQNVPVRYEHQLFIGMAATIIVVLGLIFRPKSENNRTAWLYLAAMVLLIMITLNVNGYSLYWFLWNMPGIGIIRAVARIQLVLMWPLTFFIASTVDAFLQRAQQRMRWITYLGILLLAVLLVGETLSAQQPYYSKAEGVARIAEIKRQLPTGLPEKPVLVLRDDEISSNYNVEIDAMIVAQEIGWPTLNGYSGNFPPYHEFIETCSQMEWRIKRYIQFHREIKGKEKLTVYQNMTKDIVPIGFSDCPPDWREKMPE